MILLKIVGSIVPMLIILILTPFVSAYFFMFVDGVEYHVAFITFWIFGGLYVGTLYHAKVVTEILEGKKHGN